MFCKTLRDPLMVRIISLNGRPFFHIFYWWETRSKYPRKTQSLSSMSHLNFHMRWYINNVIRFNVIEPRRRRSNPEIATSFSKAKFPYRGSNHPPLSVMCVFGQGRVSKLSLTLRSSSWFVHPRPASGFAPRPFTNLAEPREEDEWRKWRWEMFLARKMIWFTAETRRWRVVFCNIFERLEIVTEPFQNRGQIRALTSWLIKFLEELTPVMKGVSIIVNAGMKNNSPICIASLNSHILHRH